MHLSDLFIVPTVNPLDREEIYGSAKSGLQNWKQKLHHTDTLRAQTELGCFVVRKYLEVQIWAWRCSLWGQEEEFCLFVKINEPATNRARIKNNNNKISMYYYSLLEVNNSCQACIYFPKWQHVLSHLKWPQLNEVTNTSTQHKIDSLLTEEKSNMPEMSPLRRL